MSKIHSALVHLHGSVMVAIDLETTGERAGWHEIIQIGIAPLNSNLDRLEGVRPFYHNVRPLHPERAEPEANRVHKLDIADLAMHAMEPDRVADLLVEWFNKFDLPINRSLVPLAQNWPFERGFLKAWLGDSLLQRLFDARYRDTMSYANILNDRAAFAGQPAPFTETNLKHLCKVLKVENLNPHDALSDALAEAEVYRRMLMIDAGVFQCPT